MELMNTGSESEIKDEHSRLDSDTTDADLFVLTGIEESNVDDMCAYS
jgi:hypothetical protein